MSLDLWLVIDPCPHCGRGEDDIHFSITHNLGRMAEAAGIYNHLWYPEELNITTAGDLVEPLTLALTAMRTNPERFRVYDSPNGWGTYRDFVPWLANLRLVCEQHPTAAIRVSI